jgi:hypothetical protein
MTKEKAPKHVELTYEIAGGETKTVEVHLPLAHGRGEHILNHAEKLGCTDIEALREEIKNLPTD